MNHEQTLTTTEIFSAPAPKVWEALTDPALIKKYFFGTETESDWKKRSSITFRGSWEGQEYIDKGTILEIEKEKLLKYSYWSSMSGLEDKPENYAEITYQLESKKGETTLTVTQQGFKDQEAYEHSIEGWKQVLGNLKTLMES